jgi:hypothetical protein
MTYPHHKELVVDGNYTALGDSGPNGIGRTNPGCRVCRQLEATDGHRDGLYEGHFGNFPTHCPLWAALDFEHRIQILRVTGMCLKCLNPRYTLETRAQRLAHEHDKCSVAKRKRKNRYTCLGVGCFLHSWVCTMHQDTNRALMDSHARECARQRQHFAFIHPGFAGPGVKPWISVASCQRPTVNQDGLEPPAMHPRSEALATVDVFTRIAAFTKGLLDHWDTHGRLPVALQPTSFGEGASTGLDHLD